MGLQLKQALINAGLVTKEKLKDLEKEKVKARHLKEGKKMREDHLRIICEVCGKSAPDVERYSHTNRMIEGKSWLCIKCADEHKVDDECRLTHQSPQAKSNLFRREYGRTKKFD